MNDMSDKKMEANTTTKKTRAPKAPLHTEANELEYTAVITNRRTRTSQQVMELIATLGGGTKRMLNNLTGSNSNAVYPAIADSDLIKTSRLGIDAGAKQTVYSQKSIKLDDLLMFNKLSQSVWFLREMGSRLGDVTVADDGSLLAPAVTSDTDAVMLNFRNIEESNHKVAVAGALPVYVLDDFGRLSFYANGIKGECLIVYRNPIGSRIVLGLIAIVNGSPIAFNSDQLSKLLGDISITLIDRRYCRRINRSYDNAQLSARNLKWRMLSKATKTKELDKAHEDAIAMDKQLSSSTTALPDELATANEPSTNTSTDETNGSNVLRTKAVENLLEGMD